MCSKYTIPIPIIVNDDVPGVPSDLISITPEIKLENIHVHHKGSDNILKQESTSDVIVNNEILEISRIDLECIQPPVEVTGGFVNNATDGNVSSLESSSSNIEYNEDDPVSTLRQLKIKNADRPVIAHLNINFLGPKFEGLKSLVEGNVDILMISETKIDHTFPSGQFLIDGFSQPIRLDRNCHGGGIMFFTRSDLPCNEIKSLNIPSNVEAIFIEMTIRKSKWLIVGGYCPKKEGISYFLDSISKELDKLLPKYENILILGDLNSTVSEKHLNEFCQMYNLENLIKVPTCFKSTENPSSIDVMLTNKKLSFQNSMTLETGLSDHHKMIITVLKRYFKKNDPITINYRDFKSFDGLQFRNELIKNLESFENLNIDDFKNIFMTLLDHYAPAKKKIVRGNNAPFMNKILSKAFMHRSRLKNVYHKNPSEGNKASYNKYRNYCVSLLKKEKKKYYNNLDLKMFDDNRKFWQRIKPLFSEKTKLKTNIAIVENGQVTTDNTEVAEILNNYFIEAVQNLEIERFVPDDDDLTFYPEKIDDVIDVIVEKYKSHPSILKIKENVQLETKFEFRDTTEDDIFTRIKTLDPKKASIKNDIPVKVLLGSNDIVCSYLANIYNTSKNSESYPDALKAADVTPIHKAKEKISKKNYRPVSLLPILSKVYEKNMYELVFSYFEKLMSPYLFGYRRRGHSTEQFL